MPRRKSDVKFIVTVDVQVAGSEDKLLARLRDSRVRPAPDRSYKMPKSRRAAAAPVVVGFGPAGMFAGLLLARAGLRPIVVGAAARSRVSRERCATRFWQGPTLDQRKCNVQFGEGAAPARFRTAS